MQEQKPRESVLKMMEALREYDAMLEKMTPEERERGEASENRGQLSSLHKRQSGRRRNLSNREKIASVEKAAVKAKKGSGAREIEEQAKREYGVETVIVPDAAWNDAFGNDAGERQLCRKRGRAGRLIEVL